MKQWGEHDLQVVLCGQLVNAFTAALSRQFEEERWFPRDRGYYANLFRHTDRSCFDRASSLVVIADDTIFGSIDWAVPSEAQELALGVSIRSQRRPEEVEELVRDLLKKRAFSRESLAVLRRGGTESHFKGSAAEGNEFARLQLIEIIDEIILAGETGATLVVTEDDERIIREMSAFIAKKCLVLDFDFPDLSSIPLGNDETIPAALVNFSPADAASVAAVRADKLVRRYSREVARALAETDEANRRRILLDAMREAVEEEGRITSASTVIDMATFVVRALMVPVVGLALGAVGDRLKKERTQRAWHLLRVRMTEVSVRDYLNRNANF